MPNRLSVLLRCTALAAALALAACGPKQEGGNLASLDNSLVGNDADPALTSALQDQIAVDPNLVNQSNRNAVRPPETPTQAQYPAGAKQAQTGQTAQAGTGQRQAGGGTLRAPEPTPAEDGDGQASLASAASGTGDCRGAGAQFDYNRSWAGRLSPVFPLYPGGRLSEAAGRNQGDCRMRVIAFTTADAPQRVLDFYNDRAVRSGYSAEHQIRGEDHVLGGTNGSDGGAYYLIVTPLPSGGSDVALISNNGR
jgi:hypothetical protein